MTSIDDPDQERGNRHPGELVPVEEREPPQLRLVGRVDRDPEQPDVGQHEQHVPPTRPGRPRVLSGLLLDSGLRLEPDADLPGRELRPSLASLSPHLRVEQASAQHEQGNSPAGFANGRGLSRRRSQAAP
jgi:hypothetical protein